MALLFILIIQLISGLFLLSYYICFIFCSFDVISYLCFEVILGSILCLIHSFFASAFMTLLILHFFKGVFFRLNVINLYNFIWILGIFLLVLSLIVSVLGYILPFGNLGYWAYCVIKNLIILFFSLLFKILFINFNYFLSWFFIYDTRLLVYHFNLAFLLVCLVFLHIFYLHNVSSVNAMKFNAGCLSGFSMTLLKNITLIFALLINFFLFIFFNPILLGNYSNLIFVNFLFSPLHVKPEWYFCSIYAILRLFFLKLVSILMVLFYFVLLFFEYN